MLLWKKLTVGHQWEAENIFGSTFVGLGWNINFCGRIIDCCFERMVGFRLHQICWFKFSAIIAVGWHWHGRGDFIWGLGYIRDSSDSSNIVCQQINTKAIAGQCVTSGMDLLTLTFLLSFLLVLWKGPCMVDIDRGEEIWLRVGLHQGSKSQTGCDPAPHITVIRIAWLDPHWCLSLNFTECSSFLIICFICKAFNTQDARNFF